MAPASSAALGLGYVALACFLVVAVSAREAPFGDEKTYGAPYGSTPSGGSPVTPGAPFIPDTPVVPIVPTAPSGGSPVTPGAPFIPDTPVAPIVPTAPSGGSPLTPSAPFIPDTPVTPGAPYTPSTPAPYAPTDPAPYAPANPAPYTPSDPAPYAPANPAPYTPSDPAPYTPSYPAPYDPATPPASPGTCSWWSSNTSNFPDFISILTTILDLFGSLSGGGAGGSGGGSIISGIFGNQMTVYQGLRNTRNDGYGALLRQGSAAILNSYTRRDFAYSPLQVKLSFRNAMGSQQQAFRMAALFENANNALGRRRHP